MKGQEGGSARRDVLGRVGNVAIPSRILCEKYLNDNQFFVGFDDSYTSSVVVVCRS